MKLISENKKTSSFGGCFSKMTDLLNGLTQEIVLIK